MSTMVEVEHKDDNFLKNCLLGTDASQISSQRWEDFGFVEETVLSWDIQSLITTSIDRYYFKRSVIHHHTLLTNVRGCVKSGSLLAIMGPSGAGKSTLLATLSQRINGQVVGEVMINGQHVDRDLMVRISGFVPQHDLTVSCLTTLEHLTFMASMKLDRRVSHLQMKSTIDGVVNDFNLTACTNTRISALSGGEFKRLALAAQVLTDPPMLFCDEPTTGLDSFQACSVVTVLRTLTARGKMVVCSVHQPSSDLFMMFDQVCLLVPGGGLAYFGDMPGAQPYFQSLGMECPELYNPADFFLSKLNSSQDVTSDLCHKFSASRIHKQLVSDLNIIKKGSVKNKFVSGIEETFLKFYSLQPSSQHTQLKWLMWRCAVAMIRDVSSHMFRAFMFMVMALLVSTPFSRVTLNQKGVQSLQGFYSMFIVQIIYFQSYGTMHTFPAEIAIMLRETNNGVYKPGPYYFSKVFVLLPKVILETFMFSSIAFSIMGNEHSVLGFLLFSLPAVASGIVSTAYGCCMSAIFDNTSTASLVFVPVDLVLTLFNGLYLDIRSLPAYIQCVKYLSTFYYGTEVMSILQWSLVDTIPCSPEGNTCISSGNRALYKYGFSPDNLRLDLICLFVAFTVFHLIGFLALKRRSKQQSIY